MSTRTVLALLAAGASLAVAQTTHVIRSGASGLTFDPASLTAAEGDILEFHWWPQSHSVAQGDPDNACNPVASAGFFSGYVDVSSGESTTVFQVTVNDTNPIYFYCTRASHCTNGMVGVVNPPSEDALSNYTTNASAWAKDGVAPPSVFGGILADSSDSSSTTSTDTSTPTGSSSPPTDTPTGSSSGPGSISTSSDSSSHTTHTATRTTASPIGGGPTDTPPTETGTPKDPNGAAERMVGLSGAVLGAVAAIMMVA